MGYLDGQLYDLFRREEDAHTAEEAKHCFEVDGQSITVTIFENRSEHGIECSCYSFRSTWLHLPIPHTGEEAFPAVLFPLNELAVFPPHGTPYGAGNALFIHVPGH